MKNKRRRFAMIVVALVAISLLVLSVSATPFVEGRHSDSFDAFVSNHAIDSNGYYYLTHTFDKATLYEYIECEKPNLQKNPGAEIVLNLVGRDWVYTDEVIARSDNSSVVVMQDVIDRLLPEMEVRQLQWLGVKTAEGEWVDGVHGALLADPSPYFLKFAEKHAILKEWSYHLTPKLDKDTLFAYIESEVGHLAQRSSNAIATPTTLGLTPDYQKAAIVVRLYDPELFIQPELLVATTLATDNVAFANLQDKSVYTIAELQSHPEKYSGFRIVWNGQYSVVCIDMTEINNLLPKIGPKVQHASYGDLSVRARYGDSDAVRGDI